MLKNKFSQKADLEAIILAGGLGTRLRPVVSDVPKPMAPVADKPFLYHLIQYVIKQGVTRVILSIGYKGDVIIDYFNHNPCGIEISFAFETEPLGTGGAIVNGMQKCHGDSILVLNGDTFFAMDYSAFIETYNKFTTPVSMALRYLKQNKRYGQAVLQNGYIVKFESAGDNEPGWINAGIYLIRKNLFDGFDLPEKFSFEQDFIEANIQKLNPVGHQSDAAFIDIGIPDDYQRAADFIKEVSRQS